MPLLQANTNEPLKWAGLQHSWWNKMSFIFLERCFFRSPTLSMTCFCIILTWLWAPLSFSLLPLPSPTLHVDLKSQLQTISFRPFQSCLLCPLVSLFCANSPKLSLLKARSYMALVENWPKEQLAWDFKGGREAPSDTCWRSSRLDVAPVGSGS